MLIQDNNKKYFDRYILNMEQDGIWGDQYTLNAAAHALNIKIKVHSSVDGSPVYIFNREQENEIVIGHIAEVHYVSTAPLQNNIPIREQKKRNSPRNSPKKRL